MTTLASHPESPPGAVGPVDRLVDSAQKLVADHVELAALELRETLRTTISGLLLGIVAALMLILSWIGFMLWGYVAMEETATPAVRILSLTLLNCAIAVTLLVFGLRAQRPQEPTP